MDNYFPFSPEVLFKGHHINVERVGAQGAYGWNNPFWSKQPDVAKSQDYSKPPNILIAVGRNGEDGFGLVNQVWQRGSGFDLVKKETSSPIASNVHGGSG